MSPENRIRAMALLEKDYDDLSDEEYDTIISFLENFFDDKSTCKDSNTH